MLQDVFPYLKVSFDETLTLSNGRAYRFLIYQAISGYPEEPPAVAIFDEDSKLVLVDGLYSEYSSPEKRAGLVRTLTASPLAALVHVINHHPRARHKLSPDGTVPW